ncbi:DnaJ C-terminal domain-containing protein [Thiocapsa bogorovii]|uniref:DnaJ C-terminal domain-containing protein n=1 Tax=Thiocapsa bogorovii TaxID=521689 RepID=UPI001E3F3796|nr:DnaJ C-terminal domain-containing protein [Thiocapsa bogorovii]UHD18218.1 DnaJ domain-containing protein [Thiocapsa bogorovii]
MEYKDYYKTLGVARDATQAEIKRAYRKLARKFHPDVSKEADAEARFKEINEANEVLHDPEKRAAYDALGSSWHAGQDFRPPPGGVHHDFHFGPDEAAEFSDFFSSIFGREFHAGSQSQRRRRGQDQTARIAIDLEDAYRGATRQLRLDIPEIGADGRVTSRTRTLNVRIPPGVTQGRQIRLAGQGGPGINGGHAGDLYLEIEINPHPFFTTDGKDIHLRLPIAPWEAALGASVSVPTLGGTVNLKVPPGSQSGQRLRLKGRGLPGEPAGDELVMLEIVTPPATTDMAKAAYREMAERLHFNPRAEMGV